MFRKDIIYVFFCAFFYISTLFLRQIWVFYIKIIIVLC